MKAQCVICSDLFVNKDAVCAVRCGHTFHYPCLMQWFEKGSYSCPQCRHKTKEKDVIRLFFDVNISEDSQFDPSVLQNQVDSLKYELRLKEQEKRNIKDENSKLTTQNKGLKAECKTLGGQIRDRDCDISALKSQLKCFNDVQDEAKRARSEADSTRKRMQTLENVQLLIEGSQSDIEDMVQSYSVSANDLKSLSTYCILLKRELTTSREEKRKLEDMLSRSQQQAATFRQKISSLSKETETFKEKARLMEQDLQHTEQERQSLESKVKSLEQAFISPSLDPKNSAISRLLSESPAPQNLKRPRLSNPEDDTVEFTPEVIRTQRKLPMSDIGSSPYLPVKTSSVPLSSKLTGESSQLSKHFQDFSIFKKPRPALAPLSTKNRRDGLMPGLIDPDDEQGYNGLGGHSKPDLFPKPLKIKKSRVRLKNPIKMNTLDTFLS